MANKYSYILFLFFLFLISACKKDCSFLPSKENFLVRTQWKMESFVDHGENISYEPTTLVYEFRHDGTFIVYPSDSLPPHYTMVCNMVI
ncbi:MAG: hypothetical protein HY738_02900 [Bacteroidia bacterium]|nr:hypothetical protein [Bacteroidia bacterium]